MVHLPTTRVYLNGLNPDTVPFYLDHIGFGDTDEFERREVVAGDLVTPKDDVPAEGRMELTSELCNLQQVTQFRALANSHRGKLVKMHNYIWNRIHNGFIESYEITDHNRPGQHCTYSINFTFQDFDNVPILVPLETMPGAWIDLILEVAP